MADHTPADELNVFNEVRRIIDGLIKFDPDSRKRIYRTVGTFFGFDDPDPKIAQGAARRSDPTESSREPHFSTHEVPQPKDFVFQKQPNTDVERVTCLACYLAHYRATPHFKTTDIGKLNTEAAQAKLSDASDAVYKATRSGLLAAAGKGMKQLSALGEKYVEALPDRAAVKGLAPKMPKRRPRQATSRNVADGADGRASQ